MGAAFLQVFAGHGIPSVALAQPSMDSKHKAPGVAMTARGRVCIHASGRFTDLTDAVSCPFDARLAERGELRVTDQAEAVHR